MIRRLLQPAVARRARCININFPAVPPERVDGFAVTSQGKRAIADNLTEGVDPRGRPYYWIGPVREAGGAEPGTDIAALTDNKVSITPINLDLTNMPVLDPLRQGVRIAPGPDSRRRRRPARRSRLPTFRARPVRRFGSSGGPRSGALPRTRNSP